MKSRIVLYSGGMASFQEAMLTLERHGVDQTALVFCDTLIEHPTLYTFLVDTTEHLLGGDAALYAQARTLAASLSPVDGDEEIARRKRVLPELARVLMSATPHFVWLIEGRTPWDVYDDAKMLGSWNAPNCSGVLKNVVADRWIAQHTDPLDVTQHFGFYPDEAHRLESTRQRKPMMFVDSYVFDTGATYADGLEYVTKHGIALPELYAKGYTHNNCGNFCCRAGQAHFARILFDMPELFSFAERKEREWREKHGKNRAHLQRRTGNSFEPLTLQALREDIVAGVGYDPTDIGRCGCFVQTDPWSDEDERRITDVEQA